MKAAASTAPHGSELPATARRGFGETRIVWPTLVVIVTMHLLAVWALVHLVRHFSWWTLGLGIVWYLLCGISITAGYHRLFAHRSYRASPVVRALYLAFGAAAWQRSALRWSRDHRVHHRFSDSDADPYSVAHGFWWAHFGWVVSDASSREVGAPWPADLSADPLVRLQDRYWVLLALVFGAVVPMLLGMAWGDALGAVLVAGCLRVVLTWQATYSVNSFAHRFGRRPYSGDESARDNTWIALVSLGEGFHNFHHRFQADYRNGVLWYHYDPTKWFIFLLSRFGLTHGLIRNPAAAIAAARHNARQATSP